MLSTALILSWFTCAVIVTAVFAASALVMLVLFLVTYIPDDEDSYE